jgi:hypothetical protein
MPLAYFPLSLPLLVACFSNYLQNRQAVKEIDACLLMSTYFFILPFPAPSLVRRDGQRIPPDT